MASGSYRERRSSKRDIIRIYWSNLTLNPLPSAKQLNALRTVITENIRVQRGGAEPVGYVDIANALAKASSRQNHVIFGRRGCGKSLLLHESTKKLDAKTKAIYLNCEDFKNHSFPNVLIEILDSIFQELEK